MEDHRTKRHRLRLARPVRDVEASVRFYERVLEFVHLGGFEDHAGYNGAFVGPTGADWHLEFMSHTSGLPVPTPTREDLLVLYYPPSRMPSVEARLVLANVDPIEHENPYWASVGATVFADPDGYLVVVCPERSTSK